MVCCVSLALACVLTYLNFNRIINTNAAHGKFHSAPRFVVELLILQYFKRGLVCLDFVPNLYVFFVVVAEIFKHFALFHYLFWELYLV